MDPAIREYALALPGAWPDEPWDGDEVAKVGPAGKGKIFCFFGWNGGVGLKCGRSREEADEWLRQYPQDTAVMAYIGRSGWNVLQCGAGISEAEIREAIDDSYRYVVAGLPRIHRPQGWELHA